MRQKHFCFCIHIKCYESLKFLLVHRCSPHSCLVLWGSVLLFLVPFSSCIRVGKYLFQKIMFLHIDAHIHSTATWYHQFCIKIFRSSFFLVNAPFFGIPYTIIYYKVAHSIVNLSGNCIVDTNKILQCT